MSLLRFQQAKSLHTLLPKLKAEALCTGGLVNKTTSSENLQFGCGDALWAFMAPFAFKHFLKSSLALPWISMLLPARLLFWQMTRNVSNRFSCLESAFLGRCGPRTNRNSELQLLANLQPTRPEDIGGMPSTCCHMTSPLLFPQRLP